MNKSSQARGQENPATRALVISTLAFTVCFAVWTIFSIIGVRIKDELALTDTQFGLLIGMPILTEQPRACGAGHGRPLRWAAGLPQRCSAACIATFLLAFAQTYAQMLLAAGVGRPAGRSQSASPMSRASIRPAGGAPHSASSASAMSAPPSKFAAPFVLLAGGWQEVALIWAAVLGVMALVFWFATEDDPVIRERRIHGEPAPRSGRVRTAGRISASGASLSTISSRSGRSWRWRCGCRAT